MMRYFFVALFLLGLSLSFVSAPSVAKEDGPLAHVVEVKSVISPATYELITRHIKLAEKEGADVLILEIHTPGGLYDSTQDIIQAIFDSPVPVVTYVSPSGSHAASAGTYILYASHIAAMAPGTNIGAATPVQMGGGEKEKPKDDTKSTLERKMVNDASAYIKTLAEYRGRNLEWAEKAVRDAETVTASEALNKKIIDVIAPDIQTLLEKIDGKTVKMGKDKTMKLTTKGARISHHAPDWRTKLLEIITNPNIAFLLMTLGSYGLIYEVTHPGAFFPGVVGAICLLLGLYAMNVLPINYAGLMLMLLGIALMTGEAIAPGFGVLGLGGAIAFAIGGVMLIDSQTPGFGIDPWVIGITTLFSFTILSVFLAMALRAQKAPVTTGVEELLAATGEVLDWSGGKGNVRITGEIWQAITEGDYIFKKGDLVKVLDVRGLKLVIAPQK